MFKCHGVEWFEGDTCIYCEAEKTIGAVSGAEDIEQGCCPTISLERMREVKGTHSTWYECDVHDWDFTNVDGDTCPVCKGEKLAEERIIKLLEETKGNFLGTAQNYVEPGLDLAIALIKEKNK